MNGIKVAKFGGTSLADADQIRKVLKIIKADPARRFIVVSAPGKRDQADQKVTDLLYGLHRGIHGLTSMQIIKIISNRFNGIIKDLGLELDITEDLDLIRRSVCDDRCLDFLASRGEYLNARILAEALGFEFVDALHVIELNALGQFDMEATEQNKALLMESANGYVVPGFYGALPNGMVKTFSRGGSDLTGAIVAALVNADLYENWTDVSGLLMTDPQIVPSAKKVDVVTYRELRELTYMGARVLHDAVIFPLRKAGIPIALRNTNDLSNEGTVIVPDAQVPQRAAGSIVGIAGRKDLTVITVEKTLMNEEVGFMRRVCAVFERHAINIEHIPGGIDTLSVVIKSESLDDKLELIKREIEDECCPDGLSVSSNMALVCTVGHAIARTPGVAARLFQSLASAKINVRMIDQGSSEISIIVGIENDDYETAVRAIYDEFV